MKPSSKAILERLYKKVRYQAGDIGTDSVLLALVRKRKSDRHKIVSSAVVRSVPASIGVELAVRGFATDVEGGMVITGRGIFEVERERGVLTFNMLEDWFESEYFDIISSREKISDREKIILMSLIALRAFSEELPISLKMEDHIKSEIKKVIDCVTDLLIEHKVVAEKVRNSLYGKSTGNEHPISHLIRHSDRLPRITAHVFQAPGNQKYYLEATKNSRVDKDTIRMLLSIVFSDGLDYASAKEVGVLLSKIAIDHLFSIHGTADTSFLGHETDVVLKEALLEL